MTLGPEINDAGTAITLANGYAEAHNYRRAEEVLRSALVHNPLNAALLTALARVQHLAGDNVAAERSVLDALTVTPESAYAMRIYASVLDGLGRRYEGLTWARRAVEAAPWDHSTHYESARLLANSSDAQGALPVAKEALRLAPASADAHDLMGVVLGMLGRREESTAEHQEALRLQPGHARALANIAVNPCEQQEAVQCAHRVSRGRTAGSAHRRRGSQEHHCDRARVAERDDPRGLDCARPGLVQLQRHHDAADSAARVVAGLGSIVMLVMFGWLARSLPPRHWTSVLRHPEYRSLQIYLGLGVVVMCVMGAFALGGPVNIWVLGGALLLTIIVSWVAPRFDKD